jgi:predicted nucleic acid-binding protein
VGELGDFTFAPMRYQDITATSLAPYDTALLNVASSYPTYGGLYCNVNNLSAQQKADLIAFVEDGKKLIIYDSECSPQDYSWLPYPFTTSNPGAQGAQGTLTIAEDNLLSTLVGDPNCTGAGATDPHCINVQYLGSSTDAVGDMNVLTSRDANWCVDMSGTNTLNVTGPVHTYAREVSGANEGLYIYNGLDQDVSTHGTGGQILRKIWVQELQVPFNPAPLPCGISVVGITLDPVSATNPVGDDHTVTATLKDLLAIPLPAVEVEFSVLSGPNAGASGVCSANADCTTDANGEVSFTYAGDGGVGTDEIQACFYQSGATDPTCSRIVSKEWVVADNTPPTCSLAVNYDPTLGVYVDVTLADDESGVSSIEVLVANNAQVEIPEGTGRYFVAGGVQTFSPPEASVLARATLIDPSARAQVALEVTDEAGRVYECDPVLTTAVRVKGKPVTETLIVPEAESDVEVFNNDPGLKVLEIVVNGERFKLAAMKDGQKYYVDISSAMVAGDNVVELTSKGKSGSADLVFSDQTP